MQLCILSNRFSPSFPLWLLPLMGRALPRQPYHHIYASSHPKPSPSPFFLGPMVIQPRQKIGHISAYAWNTHATFHIQIYHSRDESHSQRSSQPVSLFPFPWQRSIVSHAYSFQFVYYQMRKWVPFTGTSSPSLTLPLFLSFGLLLSTGRFVFVRALGFVRVSYDLSSMVYSGSRCLLRTLPQPNLFQSDHHYDGWESESQ